MFDRIQFHWSPPDDNSLVLTPAVVITRAIFEENDKPANAFMLQVEWLIWGVGITFDFS
ncbi:MAG: hypothetical protein K9N47_05585 [Prosthecobacter sp.]|uniref:hypothetical protein n=1 Tax=Prosthecobacter sp. TaxID=1965333 RepID=UPI0025E77B53|nr:hypothetical protein [Prosthecobacter sp.]MCF7785572.1 hypothetical protein [Prosthecobacter sp.]